MKNYRKLIAAIVGVVLMLLNQKFGFSLGVGMDETVTNLILAGLTSVGVWAVPNA